jgi:uncharacterized protein (TIGR02598 family)
MHQSSARRGGFSLVEVVLAVGVVAFAFVAVLGLLPAGMTQFRQAIDTSVCAQIGQRVIMDAQQTDFDVLTDKDNVPVSAGEPQDFFTFRAPKVGAGAFRYFDEQGNEVVFTTASPSAVELSRKGVIYHVNTRIGVTTDVPSQGYQGPKNSDLATVTVEVAFNPGNQPLAVDTTRVSDAQSIRRNLLVLTPGLQVKVYGAQVGRNQ